MNTELALPISHWRRLWLYVLGGLVLLFLIAPSLIIVPMSFSGSTLVQFPPESWSLRWYEAYFGSIEWREATIVSLKVAIMTTLVATPIGTAAAYAINSGGLRFTGLIQTLLTVSLIIPVILVGIGTFFIYARVGLNNTLTGLVIAHTVQALPLVVLTVLSGIQDIRHEPGAGGAQPGRQPVRGVPAGTMPQIRFSMVSGALFAFITSFDEVVVSLFISGGDTTTLTRRMFNALRDQVDPTIAAISTCLIVLSIILLSAAQLFGRGRSAHNIVKRLKNA
jgi:putative spermidine/putrescine transport system permease protein